MDIRTLLTKRGELLDQMATLDDAAAAESRDLNDDEAARYTDLEAQVASTNAAIERNQKRLDLERQHAREGGLTTLGHWDGETDDDDRLADFDATKPAVMPYKGIEVPGARNDEEREYIRLCHAFGQQLKDVKRAHTGQGLAPELGQIQAAAQGAGEVIGSDGGFLVQTDVGGMLTRAVMGGDVLSRVRQVPISANANAITFNAVDETSRATGSRFGGVRGYWVDEGTAATATNPTFRQIEVKLYKVAALGYSTDELEQDTTAFGSVMLQAFKEELRWLAENAIINGTGAGQPLGVVGHDATVSVTRGTASEVNHVDIVTAWSRLFTRNKAGSVWLINTDVNPEIDEMYVTGASSDFGPRFVSYDAEGATRMKGKPVIETEYNATMGTVGDVVLGDFGAYLFASKAMQTATSMHVRFTTDENAYRVTWRVGGRPSWISALTPANGTNTLSPFVTIAT